MDVITLALARKYVQATLAGAGALKGENGESAYEIAKRYGYAGTEEEWLTSLIGAPGSTPYIGANLHWFINGEDTGVSAVASQDYNDLENKPTINGVELTGALETETIGIESATDADIDALFN